MSFQYQNDEPEGEADQAVDHAAESGSPIPYYTLILIAAIVAVAIVQLSTGLEDSILSAGFVKPAFLARHQYWRILTGATTHGSVMHVAMNCYALYSFGRIFEMLANRAHLALVFLFAAIGGGLLSLIFMPDGISVGASGGIVGLIGYLLVYAFRRRQFISAEFRKNLLINIGFILVFGLVLYKVIDNFGHVGGLIVGVIYGWLQIPSDPQVDPREAASGLELAGVAGLGIFIAGCLFSILLIAHVI